MMTRPIPADLYAKLQHIQPSRDGEMRYYPCRVRLRDGRTLDRVYVQPREPYLTYWGMMPDEDPGKHSIPIEEIVDLEDSPDRLPPLFANLIYEAGESGMGYTLFRVEFRDGTSIPVITGNAVDFVVFPAHVGAADVVGVRPHEGRDDDPQPAPDYAWAIFDGVQPLA